MVAAGGRRGSRLRLLNQASAAFVPAHPEALLPMLAKVAPADGAWRHRARIRWPKRKLTELDEAIALAGGVWRGSASPTSPTVTPGGTFKVTLTALARNPAEVTLARRELSPGWTACLRRPSRPRCWCCNKPIQYSGDRQGPRIAALFAALLAGSCPRTARCIRCPIRDEIGDPENAPVLSAEFRLKMARHGDHADAAGGAALCRSGLWRADASAGDCASGERGFWRRRAGVSR